MALRVRTTWLGMLGSPYLSTMYFSGNDQTAADGAVAAVAAFWGDLQGRISNQLDWQTLPDVDDIAPGGGLQGIFNVTPATGSGGAAGDPLPTANQGLIRWRTLNFTGGRNLRGRTFIPGPTEAFNDQGPISTYISQLQTAADNLLGSSATLMIWSRTYNGFHEAVVGSVWNRFAVLRSRRD